MGEWCPWAPPSTPNPWPALGARRLPTGRCCRPLATGRPPLRQRSVVACKGVAHTRRKQATVWQISMGRGGRCCVTPGARAVHAGRPTRTRPHAPCGRQRPGEVAAHSPPPGPRTGTPARRQGGTRACALRCVRRSVAPSTCTRYYSTVPVPVQSTSTAVRRSTELANGAAVTPASLTASRTTSTVLDSSTIEFVLVPVPVL